MDKKERMVVAPVSRFLMNKASKMKVPLSGTFELSPVCNFTCRMCYVRMTPQQVAAHPRAMVTLERWLQLAEEAYEAGTLYLLLTGGEPLLWPDFWKLYERLVEMGFLIAINTNGSLIDETAIARFRAHPPMRINLTLYGASDETYERLCQAKGVFSRVDRAIRGLKQAGISFKLNCSLTPYNKDDLEAMVAYAQEVDVPLDATSYMFPPLRRDESKVGQNQRFTPSEAAFYHLKQYRLQYGEEKYHEFLQKIREGDGVPLGLDQSCVDPADGTIRCHAGKSSYWITWDGYMTPCGMLTKPKVDLSSIGFKEGWEQTVTASYQIRLSGLCDKCPNRKLCHMCAATALSETGTFERIPEYLCQMIEAMREQARMELK